MPELELSNPCKRQRTEPCTLQLTQSQLKRQRLKHPITESQLPAFWDSLSKIWLTKDALKELNRRNRQSASSQLHSQYRQACQPVTQNFFAELKTQSESEFLRHCEPKILEDLKIFARNGGPDLSDLEGVSIPICPLINAEADDALKLPEFVDPLNHTMSSSQSCSQGQKRNLATTLVTRPGTNTTNSRTTESSGPYSSNFQQKLIDGGIYPDEYEYPDGRVPPEPDNLEEINQKLMQHRRSLSPSLFTNEKFREFKRADAHVSKENKATKTVIPIIEGKTADDKCVEGDVLFTNLTPLTNNMLTAAKPDLYYGARPEQLDRRVRDQLSGHIIPSTHDDLLIAPKFFLAAKGLNGTAAVARRQACYDGALGARGMYSLQSYGKEELVYNNEAYTITAIYSDGQLKLYTCHPTQPTSPGGRPEHCMTQLRTFAMTNSAESFRQGATAYRNARDWTKEQRDEAIRRANEVADDSQVETLVVDASFRVVPGCRTDSQTSLNKNSNTTADPPESESSTDELALDYKLPAKRLRRHSKLSHQP